MRPEFEDPRPAHHLPFLAELVAGQPVGADDHALLGLVDAGDLAGQRVAHAGRRAAATGCGSIAVCAVRCADDAVARAELDAEPCRHAARQLVEHDRIRARRSGRWPCRASPPSRSCAPRASPPPRSRRARSCGCGNRGAGEATDHAEQRHAHTLFMASPDARSARFLVGLAEGLDLAVGVADVIAVGHVPGHAAPEVLGDGVDRRIRGRRCWWCVPAAPSAPRPGRGSCRHGPARSSSWTQPAGEEGDQQSDGGALHR